MATPARLEEAINKLKRRIACAQGIKPDMVAAASARLTELQKEVAHG